MKLALAFQRQFFLRMKSPPYSRSTSLILSLNWQPR